MNKFSERLKISLKANKLSQFALAIKVGMSQSVINKYCLGKREPSLDSLILICKVLNESADYLLGLVD